MRPGHEKARNFLENVHQYSNLLVERGHRQYGFIHLTFEEVLAAYGLFAAGQLDRQKSLDNIRTYLTDPGWHETILLAAWVCWDAGQHQPLAAGEVVRAMLKMDCPGDAGLPKRAAGRRLPGRRGRNRPGTGSDQRSHRSARAGRPEPQPAARHSARRRVYPGPPGRKQSGGFCSASAPTWTISSRSRPANSCMATAMKSTRKLLREPFAIGKYPVTNLQYRSFIEAGGYEDERWWSADGWAWRSGRWDSKAPEEYRDWLSRRPPEKRNQPFFWQDAKWNNPLAPVVGMSWFEAEAYCTWYSSRPEKQPGAPANRAGVGTGRPRRKGRGISLG